MYRASSTGVFSQEVPIPNMITAAPLLDMATLTCLYAGSGGYKDKKHSRCRLVSKDKEIIRTVDGHQRLRLDP